MDKGKVVSSLAFKFIERLAVKGIGLVISVLLARLLSPDDFGVVAIMTVFINLSQTLIQSGLNSALVQNKDVTDDDYSTVFYITFSLAVVFIVLLTVFAPLIGRYYENDTLVMPLRIYSLTLVFGAFNSVQVAKMQRNMRFKSMMLCTLSATIISGVIGVVLAYMNAGIWALITYYAAHVIVTSIAMLFVERWLPRKVFSVERAKVLFSFGWKMLVSSVLCSIYNDLRSLIIGKKFSTGDLGYYNRGQQFPNIISNTLDNSIQSVMFPTLASAQESPEKMKAMLRRSMSTGALIILPVMAGLAVIAEPFVRLLLTEKWLPCVVFMQLICIAEANIPFASSNLIAIKAMGRSDIYMKLEVIRRIAMLVVLAITVFCFHSVYAIAVGYLISAWLDVVIIALPMKRILNYSIIEQFTDNWKTFVATAVMGVVVILMGHIAINYILLMVAQIICGGIVYIFLCHALKIESYQYALQMVQKLGRRR
jgi:teichuronic acid exporter